MSTALIEIGKGVARTVVYVLAKGEVDALLLVGGSRAKITVEIQTDDGVNRPDNTPQFRDYAIMDGQVPLSCVVHMVGPIEYVVRRDEGGVPSGCNVLGKHQTAPSDPN